MKTNQFITWWLSHKKGISLAIGAGIVIGLLLVVGFVSYKSGEKAGSILKSRQIGEVAKYCYGLGGILFIDKKAGGLELNCNSVRGELTVPVCSDNPDGETHKLEIKRDEIIKVN